jgi:hypothetical protein
MPLSTEYITADELAELNEAVLAPADGSKGAIVHLDNPKTPGLNMLMAKSEGGFGNAETLLGGARFMCQGARDQRIEWWDGAQKLSFHGSFEPFHLDYYLGKGHFGNLEVLDVLERAGIKVAYGANPNGRTKKSTGRVVYNILDSLFPASTNSTGTVGGKSRAGNPLLRHQLVTGVTASNAMASFTAVERASEDSVGQDGSGFDAWFVGDNFYDMLTDMWFGASGKLDFQMASDRMQKYADKIKIGVPLDAFVGPGNRVFLRDPTWARIDRAQAPSVKWGDKAVGINFRHFGLLSEKHLESIQHQMPYDQRVMFSSLHGAYLEWTDMPGAQAVLVKSS